MYSMITISCAIISLFQRIQVDFHAVNVIYSSHFKPFGTHTHTKKNPLLFIEYILHNMTLAFGVLSHEV